ncbi:MAG: hypothetical protein U1E77_17560 [Inhella sp.]
MRRNLGWIRALSPGRDGRMWISSDTQGLLSYDPARDRVDSHSPSGAAARRHPRAAGRRRGAGLDRHRGPGPAALPPRRERLDTEAIPWREQTESRWPAPQPEQPAEPAGMAWRSG